MLHLPAGKWPSTSVHWSRKTSCSVHETITLVPMNSPCNSTHHCTVKSTPAVSVSGAKQGARSRAWRVAGKGRAHPSHPLLPPPPPPRPGLRLPPPLPPPAPLPPPLPRFPEHPPPCPWLGCKRAPQK
eukprot:scaffold41744_cov62-Phaeocystis_antarctica.AAC.5